MPALQPYIIQPIWQQFEALLPERQTNHPLYHLNLLRFNWTDTGFCARIRQAFELAG